MTIGKAWAFQVAITNLMINTLDDIPVTATVPNPLPPRYCRLDGFQVVPFRQFKKHDKARHLFIVHLFDAPEGGTDSLSWVKQTAPDVVNALSEFRLDDQSELVMFDSLSVGLEPFGADTKCAHAIMRFSATIGA